MTTREVADRLVALCREGKPDEAVATLYGADIVSVEAAEGPGFGREAVGLDAVRAKGEWWQSNHEVHGMVVKGPWMHGDDRFAVYFEIDFTMKQTGQRLTFDEVGVYTVRDGKIVREEFFFTQG